MPVILTELRVQVEGNRMPLLVKRTSLQVGSVEQFSLTVEGVPAARSNTAGNGKAAGRKPQQRVMKATYQPTLSHVKFVAIYDGGQATGLRIRVGSGKPASLTQPLVFMDRAASALGKRPRIIVENESAAPRTAVMLVGSDLPQNARKVELVEHSTRARPAQPTGTRKRPAMTGNGAGAAAKKSARKKASK